MPHRTARVDPSNTARNPSPVVVISRPRKMIEVVAQESVVGRQHVAPCGVPDPFQRRRRIHDVGEENGREDALARPFRRDAERPGTRPLQGHPRVVTHDPRVVTRWDLVDRVRQDVELVPVVGHDMHHPGDRVAEVVELAGRRSRHRRHVRRPSPARHVRGAPHDGLVELEDLGAAMRERPQLVRRGEGAGLQAWHVSSFWTARPTCSDVRM